MSIARIVLALLGALLCAGLVVLTVQGVAEPRASGPLALAQVIGPWLFLALVPLLLLVRTRGAPGAVLRLGLALAIGTFVVRYLPAWLPSSPAQATAGTPVEVATWNLELGEPSTDGVLEALRALDARVVGLTELTPGHADAIAADPELRLRLPSMVLRPRGGSLGIGLLTDLRPLGEPVHVLEPPVLVQRLATEAGDTVTVVVAHPLPGTLRRVLDLLPLGYDPATRDADLAVLRGIVDPLLASGEPLLVIGDFNTVEAEPAYATLAEGLVDAQRAVGTGPGFTWRPPRLDWLPFGILRIDYLFGGNGVQPVSIAVDCTPRGTDHCLVAGAMALP